MTYYDTSRDLLIEDMQGLETILLALQGVGPELTDKAVITASPGRCTMCSPTPCAS